MGQQQLLFVLLGIIIVGIALAVSIGLFRSSSINEKRNLLINEGSSLASLAMSYYKKPSNLGGGERSFLGWSIPEDMAVTASGNYRVTTYKDSAVIICTGNEVVTGNDSVKVKITVLSENYKSSIIN